MELVNVFLSVTRSWENLLLAACDWKRDGWGMREGWYELYVSESIATSRKQEPRGPN